MNRKFKAISTFTNTPNLVLAVLFLGFLGFQVVQGKGGYATLALYSVSVMSVISFALYAKDKHAAINSHWRISEKALHIADLLGGWPGGALAQQVFRHKTTKVPFRWIYWATVALNSSVVVFYV